MLHCEFTFFHAALNEQMDYCGFTIIRNTLTVNAQGKKQKIPCNMINCFCMYSDYEPLTLNEWIILYDTRQKLLHGNCDLYYTFFKIYLKH